MSNSRLEKFIYAICGMEVDDLPTPLSRIETLWNCLITGETPDFEPLSRNEKYLMSMLTGDVDALPEPASRSEKLLYKIATGETDLTDVPGYLSRYEELLKHLIENGGIGGTDFEYVLYTLNDSFSTLYSTAEAPVKSAILKGCTLVNQSTTSELTFESAWQGKIIEGNALQSGKKYFASFDLESDNSELTIQARNGNSFVYHINKGFTKGKNVLSFILEQDANGLRFQVGSDFNVKISNIIILEYQDGMENRDIPYFEGIQSVKMPVLTTTGKNLFDGEIEEGLIDTNTGEPQTYGGRSRSKNFIRVPKNTDLYIKIENGGSTSWTTIYGYDENKKYLGCITNSSGANKTFNTGDASYIKWKNNAPMDTLGNIQIEQGSTATSYEPYKSNILTTTSKNLFDMNRPYDNLTDSQASVVQDTNQITVSSSAESGIYVNANFILDKDFFAGKTVTGSCLYESDENDIGTVQITYQDGDGEYHYQWIKTPRTFTFPNSFIGDVMLSISANNTGTPQSNTVTVKNIQLELGSTATPYEPYSEVTLRGIGDVRDTLDGNTGELIQRISNTMSLDTTNFIIERASTLDSSISKRYILKPKNEKVKMNGAVISSLFSSKSSSTTRIVVNTLIPRLDLFQDVNNTDWDDVTSLNEYLVSKNAQIQYELETPTIKTVGLSITDQDGQPTKLSTFNDVTHVSIEAEDLLPTVDLEVPTKIEETLSSLPTQMIDISETQQILNEKIDEQAENINEVSTAMAEIRSDIL